MPGHWPGVSPTTSAGWVAARDLAGLREIVDAERHYPELVYVMILDRDGRVLAHSDVARLGQFVRDLPATAETTLLASSPALVDAVAPVMLAGRHIGWGRVGLAQETSRARLAEITRDGILYALAAIFSARSWPGSWRAGSPAGLPSSRAWPTRWSAATSRSGPH
jgi:hypothetical protein